MFNSLRKSAWIIVFWFALLQIISPFIHTHLGADHLTETASLHIHVDEHDHSTDHNDSHFLSDPSPTIHTITVAPGLIKVLDISLSFYAVLFVLFCLLARTDLVRSLHPSSSPPHDYSFKRRRPAPRAPPLF